MLSFQRRENDRLLDIFWQKATDATRWGRRDLLRRWAYIDLHTVDPSIRTNKKKERRTWPGNKQSRICWCCRERASAQKHHILMVKHGGLTIRRNIVDLCGPCHIDVHRTYQPDDPRIAYLPRGEAVVYDEAD